MPSAWTTILRHADVAVHMQRDWHAHADQAWVLLELENCGTRDIGIDYVPGHDELTLGLRLHDREPMIISWRTRSPPDEDCRAVARMRWDAGTIYARLGPKQRWRFPSKPVDVGEAEEVARVRGTAYLDGHLRLVTAASHDLVEFLCHRIDLPAKIVRVDALPTLEPKHDLQPETMSGRLRGISQLDADAPTVEVLRLRAPSLFFSGFAPDDARIPASHEPILDELAYALEHLPGYFRLHAYGFTLGGATWPGSGADELALARARAIGDRLGAQPTRVRVGQTSRHRGRRGVELWMAKGDRSWTIDTSFRLSEVLPRQLFALIRCWPQLQHLPDEARPALRELEQLHYHSAIALLAPECASPSDLPAPRRADRTRP